MFHRCLTRLWVALALVLLAGGCATYVNVPAQLGDMAENNPNSRTVVQIEQAALKAALDDQPMQGGYRVILPAGTSPESCALIAKTLTEHSMPPVATGGAAAPTTAPSELPALEARQIRVRGWYGQVDLIRPVGGGPTAGPRELVTIDLKWDPVNHWQPTDIRVWQINVEQALQRARIESHLAR